MGGFYSKTLDSEELSSISSDIESKLSVSEKPQTHDQKVTNTPKVISINYTPDDEQELKTHLNSVYRLLLKKRFSNSDILSFSSRLLSINQFKPPNQNGSVAHNLYHRCGGFWGKAKRVFDDIVKDCSAEEDKTRLIQQVKRTPDHLICDNEKDLLIKFIDRTIDESEFEQLVDRFKSHVEDAIFIHFSDIVLPFFRHVKSDLESRNLYDYDFELIGDFFNLDAERLIYQFVMRNIEGNLDDDTWFRLKDYFYNCYYQHFEDYLNQKISEIYSFNFEQQTDTKNVESPDLVSKPLDSEAHPISSDIESKHSPNDKLEIDDQSVESDYEDFANSIRINYTPEDEQELKTQLNSVYRLLLKKRYNDPDVIRFSSLSSHSSHIDESISSIKNAPISNIIFYLCGSTKDRAKGILDDIVKDCITDEDRARLIEQVERAPDHLFYEKEKDLLIKFIINTIDESELAELLGIVMDHIRREISMFSSDTLLAFLTDINTDSGSCNPYEHAVSLISDKINSQAEIRIDRLLMRNILRNFRRDLAKRSETHFTDFNVDEFDNLLNRNLSEIYSFFNFKKADASKFESL
ncbi:hypothetical protein TpMuguga_02g00037 [Theileria parva strain Muguga]|uniref:Uncharacterized protein n=1 Tax=Theileria parva TaxID=5875 RepID=Q4N6A0_THEPA|nr:uncharacterized protein TpMuguga_02g00037 [Theileria parva strain Muguga]EAN32323.1 hypothetical protein TpMuguga_02g00037 [Theileria parva strain Muguga]|eukprot:XP_764606.1 hypothetical protein [Theileria parva strain Muguga]